MSVVSLHRWFHGCNSIRYERIVNHQREILILDMDCMHERLANRFNIHVIHVYMYSGIVNAPVSHTLLIDPTLDITAVSNANIHSWLF